MATKINSNLSWQLNALGNESLSQWKVKINSTSARIQGTEIIPHCIEIMKIATKCHPEGRQAIYVAYQVCQGQSITNISQVYIVCLS